MALVRARAREDAAFAISEHVQDWLRIPLPSAPERRERMLRVLMGLAEAEGVPVETPHRIKAAEVVLAHSPVDVAEELKRALGDPRKALAFLRVAIPQLEAEVAEEERKGS